MADNAALVRLSTLVAAKIRKDGLSLRDAALASQVSAPTLSRLCRGAMSGLPDGDTLRRLANWLGVSTDSLLEQSRRTTRRANATPKPTVPEVVAAHLRADKNLAPDTAQALAEMFKQLYRQFTENTDARPR